MSNPDVKDEAGDRAKLIDPESRRLFNAGFDCALRLSAHAAAQAREARGIDAPASDAKDKRIAEPPISDAQGIEWFERTFELPLGDMPGRLDVEACRARAAESQLRLTGTEDAGVRALVETMHAEMRHDEITGNPLWFCTEADGRGEVSELHTVELAADLFPEGTVISITEPLKPFRRT